MKTIKSINLGEGNIFCKPIWGGLVLNVAKDGNVHTIKAQYYKTSLANFVRTDTGFSATGVIQIVEEKET